MTPPLDSLIDHAADLQRQVDQLGAELLLCYLAIVGLSLLVGIVALMQWRAAQ